MRASHGILWGLRKNLPIRISGKVERESYLVTIYEYKLKSKIGFKIHTGQIWYFILEEDKLMKIIGY